MRKIIIILFLSVVYSLQGAIINEKLYRKAETHFENREWSEALSMYNILLIENPKEVKLYVSSVERAASIDTSSGLTERVESDDYKRNKSLLDDWDRTADVRFQWTEQAALQQRIRTSEEELEQLKEKYRSLSVGLGQLERMQVQCREQWEACETYLSGVQEKVPVYESLQSLSALSDQIQHALLQSEDYRKEKAHKVEIHQKTLEGRQGATASYEQARKVAEEKQQEVAACRMQLEDLQVEELRQKKQEADARLDGWKKLREALSVRAEKEQAWLDVQKNRKTLQDDCRKQQQTVAPYKR